MKQTVVVLELRSHVAVVFGALCLFEYAAVCAATAWVGCDLGPAYVNNSGQHELTKRLERRATQQETVTLDKHV